MKKFLSKLCMILAIACMIIGPLLGVHVTFVQMFYGGVVDLVQGATLVPIEAMLIAKGIVKILLCAVPGVVTGIIGVIASVIFMAGWEAFDD